MINLSRIKDNLLRDIGNKGGIICFSINKK